MAVKSGILANSKPNGSALLYRAPIDSSVSAVINVSNDGTGAAHSIGLKNYDQRLALNANTYEFRPGYVVSNYLLSTTTPIPAGATPGSQLLAVDGTSTAKFNRYVIPETTTIFVKDVLLKRLTLGSVSGVIGLGDTLTKGSGGDTTTALVFEVFVSGSDTIAVVGPETVNGSGTAFADGDILTATSGGNGTIGSGGIGTAGQDFVFSTTTAGGVYNSHFNDALTVLLDRTYRFDVSDSSMTNRLFQVSQTANGEFGPDGDFGATGDNGTELTAGKTTSGTAGSSGAYVQIDMAQTGQAPGSLYYYDGGTGDIANAAYGGTDRFLTMSNTFTYDQISVYDVSGTWSATTTFTFNSLAYTVNVQTAGKYGYVRNWDSASQTLDVILGEGSAAFAGTNTFEDTPLVSASSNTATVSSVTTDATAIADDQYFINGKTVSANSTERYTSIVLGPGDSIIVNSASQNNSFILNGFQENSDEFTVNHSA